jgi:asparagine synthase (glutamine-hydrolysing)
MLGRIVHRGPDDDGVYVDERAEFALAMRRLSIIDLGGGAQPMKSPDGRYVIVYNGEIYNAKELRKELEGVGERFLTDHSDTEVLLHLLIREGEACLGRINGMFAFAFYDSRERVLLCARDRFGIKPFYYSLDGGRFAFASELKALLRLPFIRREIDRQSLFDYLSLQYVPAEQSILASARRLPAGHLLKYRLATSQLEIKRWWQLQFEPDRSVAASAWPALIRDELRQAVLRWSQSDVPIAVSLSGGLDSSGIGALAPPGGLGQHGLFAGLRGRGRGGME